MSRRFLTLLFSLLIYSAFAQRYPVSPNLFDENGKRTGHWTIIYDSSFVIVNSADSMQFYRLIRFEGGVPVGKIRDFSKTGFKYWDGYAKSIDPYVFHGESNHYHENGKLSFRQNYVDGKREGPCAEFYANGSKKSIGQFKDDKQEGKWLYYYENGKQQVEMTFIADRKTGPAKFYYDNGNIQEQGSYKDGYLDGIWFQFYEDGSKSGLSTYKRDTLDGRREYYYADGKIKEKFTYKKGHRDGTDTEYFENGKVKNTGEYKNGKQSGIWNFYFESGQLKSRGPIVDDWSHGFWEYFYENGKISYKGNMENGLTVGQWNAWYDNGVFAKQTNFERDTLNGPYVEYHLNGKKKSEGMKSRGKDEGPWKNWNDQGILTSEGLFVNGERSGLWKFYYETGELFTESMYTADELDGLTSNYFQSGRLKDRVKYVTGKADSLYVAYYENGNMRGTGVFEKGIKDGVWKWYFEDGKLSDINTWVKGKETGPTVVYYPNGMKRIDAERRDNIMYGTAKFYFRNGTLYEEGSYVNGLYNGNWLIYDSATKRLKEDGNYILGVRNGITTEFDVATGKQTSKRYYINGWEESVTNIQDSIYHLIRIRDFDNAFKAVKWMQSVEKRDYKNPADRLTSLKMTARIYAGIKDHPKTYAADIKYLKAVEKYQGNNTLTYKTALHNVATALHNMKRYDEAFRYYDQAIEIARPKGLVESYWSTVVNKVYAYYDAGKPEDAVSLLNEELTKAERMYGPDSSAAWYLRYEAAYYYWDRPSDYKTSAKLLEDLIDDMDAKKDYNNETWFDANYKLGQIYNNQFDRYDDAIKPYTAAVKYAEANSRTDTPAYGEILSDLFYIHNNHNVLDTTSQRENKILAGKLKQVAATTADQATKAESYLAVGNNEYNQNNYKEAFEWFKKAEQAFIAAGKANGSRHASVLQSLAFSLHYSDRLRFVEAERYFLKAIEIKKKVFSQTTVAYYSSLRQLSEFYSLNERYETAAQLVKEVKKICLEINDVKTIARADQELGEINYRRWRYAEAIENFKDAIKYYETKPTEFADSYVISVSYIAACYRSKEQFEEAITWSRKSIALAESLFTKKSTYYLYRVSGLALIYQAAERYSEALKNYNEAAAGFAELRGAESEEALQEQINIVETLYKMSDYKRAITVGEQLKTVIVKKFTVNNDLYLSLLPLLAQSYDNINEYDPAEENFTVAVDISRQINGERAPTTAVHLSRLGRYYDRRNRYDDAFNSLTEAVDIMRASEYSHASAIVQYLGYLGVVMGELDKNKEAEALYNEGFAIASKDSINNITTFVSSGQELSRFYSKVGRFREAEGLLRRLTKLIADTDGKTYYYCQTRNELVYMYYRLGRYDEAIVEAKELLDIMEDIASPDHWLILRLRNYLGIIYDDQAEYEKARTEFVYCIDASKRKKTLTEVETASLATFNSNVARIELCLGNYDAALKHLDECDRLRKQYNLKEGQTAYAATMSNKASYYQATGKWDKAEQTWAALNKSLLDFSRRNFYFMTDEEKAQFWKSYNGYFQIFQSFAAQRSKQNPAVIAEMYNVQLATKAILLSASNKIRKRILSSSDTSMVNMYYKWTRKREQLAQLYSSGTSDASTRLAIDSLEIAAKVLEKDMNISAEDLSKDKGGDVITWKNVQSVLTPDEAAIEIVRFKHYDRYWRDSTVYAAMVVTSETKQNPKFVVLNNGKLLEGRYLKFYRNSIANRTVDSVSYRQYWGALDDVLKGKSRVYLSLDGVYNQINLNTLKKTDGGYLVDDKNLTILSNTKDILAIKSRKLRRMSLSSATLFGFPTYFLGKEQVKPTPGSTRDFDAASLENDRTGISPLLGTQEEIKKVGSILETHKIKAEVFTNEMASEHAIKQLQHPRVLHIATHGFFVEEENSALAIAAGSESNPLLRAGLLLAGASNFIQNRARLDEENGILTAYEAANLDLDNTDLVVLSACETGKGEVQNGEGVYGLQRAFQTAGAQTIVMSLWKVDDTATQQLMTSFYTNWMNGMSKAEALKSAQITLKKQFPHPYYWGAFVMLEN